MQLEKQTMNNIEQTERAHNLGPMNGEQDETSGKAENREVMTENEKQMEEAVYVIECTEKTISKCKLRWRTKISWFYWIHFMILEKRRSCFWKIESCSTISFIIFWEFLMF